MPTVRSSKGGRPARVYDPAQERQKALEQLRQELRHQRAENNTLQASRLFREFRLVAEQQGNSSAERSSSTHPDARARAGADSASSSLNHQLIGSKPAADGPAPQENRLSEGIWSTAGQPYSCLGRPEEVFAGLSYHAAAAIHLRRHNRQVDTACALLSGAKRPATLVSRQTAAKAC